MFCSFNNFNTASHKVGEKWRNFLSPVLTKLSISCFPSPSAVPSFFREGGRQGPWVLEMDDMGTTWKLHSLKSHKLRFHQLEDCSSKHSPMVLMNSWKKAALRHPSQGGDKEVEMMQKGTMAHTCQHSRWEIGAVGTGVHGYPTRDGEFDTSLGYMRPWLKHTAPWVMVLTIKLQGLPSWLGG